MVRLESCPTNLLKHFPGCKSPPLLKQPHRLENQRNARLAIAEGSDVIVACGGDGTIHEIINGIKPCLGSTVTPVLAVLPAGRCNDFSTSISLPDSPIKLAVVIKTGNTKKIDLGKVGERFFATVATLGFDSEVESTLTPVPLHFS